MKKIFFIFMSINLLFLLSCEDKSVDNSDTDLQVDEAIVDQAALGFQFNQYAGTGNEIVEYTTPNESDDTEIPDFGTAIELKEKANTLFRESQIHLKKYSALNKTNGDSLLFEFRDTTAVKITRLALYLDFESGIARYEVVSRFLNSNHRVQYDSTSLRVAVNNIDLDNDDRFQDLYNLQSFKEGLLLQSIENQLTATNWANDGEVTAFEATTTSIYSEDRQLEKVVSGISLNADESGTLTQTFYFRDGTSSVHTATFNTDGTGSFSRTFRNGASISGTFNVVEDDGQGSYESTITFPSGSYLVTIFRSAILAFDFINEEINGQYKEVITFNNGEIDSANVDILVSKNMEGDLTTVLDITRRNGAFGQLTFTETDDISTLDGTWTTWDDFYVIITAEYYGDGSAWLQYQVWLNETRYNNGAPPLTVVEYNFMPDGSGLGNLTSEGDTYEIDIESSGTAKIMKDGESKSFELYR